MEEDPVVYEIPVFMNDDLKDALSLLQFPLRPSYRKPIAEPTQARIKPRNQIMQMDYPLNHHSEHFDPDAEDYLKQKYLVLESALVPPLTNYAVGVFREGQFHMTQLHSVYQMRPSLAHIDEAVENMKEDFIVDDGEEVQEDEKSQQTQELRVQMRKKESDRAIKARKNSYAYKRQLREAEKWTELSFMNSDEISEVFEQLFCEAEEDIKPAKNAEEYLDSLRYPRDDLLVEESTDADIKMKDAIENSKLGKLMRLKKVLSLHEVCKVLDNINVEEILNELHDCTRLVKGRLAVKSSLLSSTEEDLRDAVLYLFNVDYKNDGLSRPEVAETLGVKAVDLKAVLQDYGSLDKQTRRWFLKGDKSDASIEGYRSFEQKQEQLWSKRLTHLRTIYPNLP